MTSMDIIIASLVSLGPALALAQPEVAPASPCAEACDGEHLACRSTCVRHEGETEAAESSAEALNACLDACNDAAFECMVECG
jgi:hypothetical protein